jgi:DNA-binding response OmpR family regulator
MSKSILVVDDDKVIRHILASSLQQDGFQTQMAECAETALAMIQAAPPDLVLLDIGLPGMDGLDALRRIPKTVPVILVTGRCRPTDEVLGLELGAHDYITKPVSRDVLLARVHTVLRRGRTAARPAPEPASLCAGELVMNPASHSVTITGRPVNLTSLEFRLLYMMALQPDKVLTTEELLTSVWGPRFMGESQVLYVCMRGLRAKIEEEPHQPRRLLTVRGVGYRYAAHEEARGQMA